MSSLDARVMPFGKYKGDRVDSVAIEDPGYLGWAMLEVDMDRWPGLFEHIYDALGRVGESTDEQ